MKNAMTLSIALLAVLAAVEGMPHRAKRQQPKYCPRSDFVYGCDDGCEYCEYYEACCTDECGGKSCIEQCPPPSEVACTDECSHYYCGFYGETCCKNRCGGYSCARHM